MKFSQQMAVKRCRENLNNPWRNWPDYWLPPELCEKYRGVDRKRMKPKVTVN